jgi:cytochrome c553
VGALAVALLGVLVGSAHAASDPALRQKLEARIATVEKDSAARAKAIAAGRDHAVLCAYCHGPDGNSAKPDIPNLAAQNPVYLLEQFERFADGRREDYTRVMQRLAASLSAEEKVMLAVYYASVALTPAHADLTQAQAGLPIYTRHCDGCHGRDGSGLAGYARLAGQQPQYLRTTLKAFRDRKGGRLSPEMDSATRTLTDEDIDALAAYLANLR